MSFGNTQRFNLEFVASMQGGAQVASQINQVNTNIKSGTMANQQAAKSYDDLGIKSQMAGKNIDTIGRSSKSAGDQISGTSRHVKSLAFGILGMTTAAAEAVGMFSMWSDTQRAASEANEDLQEAIQKYGKDSHEATRATQEYTKAQRFANMTTRNMMLSMFDLIPFTVITIASVIKLVAARKAQKIAEDLVTAAITKQIGSQQLQNVSTLASVGAFKNKTIELGRATVATNVLTVASSRLSGVLNTLLLKVLGPIGIALAVGAAAALAYQSNFAGLRGTFDGIGVAIGNALPFLKGFLDKIKELALAFPNLSKMKDVLFGSKEGKEPEIFGFKDKELDDFIKRLQELNQAAGEYVITLSQMDKKEMNAELFHLGIKGGAKNDMKDALKNIEDINESVEGLSDSLLTIRQMRLFDGLKGLDLDKITSKIFFTLEDRMDEASEMFKKGTFGKDVFNALEDVMKTAAKNPGQAPEIVANYLANNPKIMEWLKQRFPGIAADLQTIADEALEKALKKSPNTVIDIDPFKDTGRNVRDVLGITKATTVDLPDVKQKVIIDMQDTSGKTYGATGSVTAAGAAGLGSLILSAVKPLFSPAAWHNAVVTLGDPNFWEGTTMMIHNFIGSHISRLKGMAGPTADGSGGNDMGQGVGFSNWVKFVSSALHPLFSSGIWYTGLVTEGNAVFWQGLTQQINGFINDNLSRLQAMQRGEGDSSGGMDIGQGQGFSNWIKYATDMLAPIFKPENWQTALGGLLKGFQKFVDGISPQVANAISKLPPIEPEFDFMNDAPIAHHGMIFNRKTGRWEKQKKGGPHAQQTTENGGRDSSGIPGTWGNAYSLLIGDREDKGKEINKFDQMARQIVQITSNLNQMGRALVQVIKDINQLARATVTQTKDNDQLARTLAQLTKNNNTYAKTIVTVTKDLNQSARATVQGTKNNNTFAKTIVETTKDFNTMARATNQNTKNLNTFARAVNQTTSNVKKLTSALNDIPNNVNVRIGVSGPGRPFLGQLL